MRCHWHLRTKKCTVRFSSCADAPFLRRTFRQSCVFKPVCTVSAAHCSTVQQFL